MGDDFQIVSPTQIRVMLYDQGESAVGPVTMTVTQPTGIVDADDAQPWAGTANLHLPFP